MMLLSVGTCKHLSASRCCLSTPAAAPSWRVLNRNRVRAVSLVSCPPAAPTDATQSSSVPDVTNQQQTTANSPVQHQRQSQQGSAAITDRVSEQASGPKPPTTANTKLSSVKPHILTLLGAATVLAAACAVMPLPGLLACVLLLSAVAIMESFWRRFLPGQNTWTAARAAQRKAAEQEDTIAQALAAATAPGLEALAKAPAEVAAWLHSAERDLWSALWQPLLTFREEWQDAMTLNGPYAWAYDASAISIGSLTPTLAGAQALADPSTGAIVAVEADMVLDSSAAPGAVDLEVLARGPIGKYAFSLQGARVQGRVHLVPVPQLGLLLVQYIGQPAVNVQLSTAYPAMLPHNRTKLEQVGQINEMLQESLQGVLASTDVVRLDYTPEFPASFVYCLEAAVRAGVAWATHSHARVSTAVQQYTQQWTAPAGVKQEAVSLPSTPKPLQDAQGVVNSATDAAANLVSSASSRAVSGYRASSTASTSTSTSISNNILATAGLSDVSISSRNTYVSQSAALVLAAQRAAWQQQGKHTATTQSSTSTQEVLSNQHAAVLQTVHGTHTCSGSRTAEARGSRDRSASNVDSINSSSSHLGAGWQLSSTYSEALECWTATGLTARLSAAATEAAASSTPQHTPGPLAGSAAAALGAHGSTWQLIIAPVGPASSKSKQRSGAPAGTKHTSHTQQQKHPVKLVAASNLGGDSYLVFPTSAAGSRGGLEGGMLGAGCLLAVASSPPAAQRTASGPPATLLDASSSGGSTNSSREGKVISGNKLRSNGRASTGSKSMQGQTATGMAMTAFPQDSLSAGSSVAAGASAAALAMPDPRQRASLLPFLASVSAVVVGSGLLLGLF